LPIILILYVRIIIKMFWLPLMSAIPTPFYSNNKNIDFVSLEKLIKNQLKSNVGIVLFGTTGECVTISDEEKMLIMDFIIRIFNEDINSFVIGIGGNNTSECIELMLDAYAFGFRKFMATTPYYNKPTQEGLKTHFLEIEKFMPDDSNLILYNVPGRTGVNLLPETVQNIVNQSKHKIIGIKEASGNLSQMIKIRELLPEFKLYCGDDGLVIPAMSIGCFGLISVISNVYPKEFSEIIRLCKEEKFNIAFEQYIAFNKFIELLFKETSPSPIKSALVLHNYFNTDNVRLPLVKTSQSLLNELKLFIEK
jgi:4-hydroxy-tetrahydrodipicolinate synthase